MFVRCSGDVVTNEPEGEQTHNNNNEGLVWRHRSLLTFKVTGLARLYAQGPVDRRVGRRLLSQNLSTHSIAP